MTGSLRAKSTASILLLVLASVLAGCSGGDDASAPDAVGPTGVGDAGFDGEGGTIRGIVTNQEQQPIGDALVAIVDVVEARTGANGTFELSNVPPGEQRVVVQALGYNSVAKRVQVEAAATADVTIELEAVAIAEATHETIILAGHICFQTNIAAGLLVNFGNVACGGQGSIFIDFDVNQGLETLIAEMTWVQTSALTAPELDLRIWQGGARSGVFSCDFCYGAQTGPSPIYLRIDGSFEGVEEAESETVTLTNTVYVPPDPSVPVTGTNIVFDQRVDLYDTMFYGAEAPDGFSAVPDA